MINQTQFNKAYNKPNPQAIILGILQNLHQKLLSNDQPGSLNILHLLINNLDHSNINLHDTIDTVDKLYNYCIWCIYTNQYLEAAETVQGIMRFYQ